MLSNEGFLVRHVTMGQCYLPVAGECLHLRVSSVVGEETQSHWRNPTHQPEDDRPDQHVNDTVGHPQFTLYPLCCVFQHHRQLSTQSHLIHTAMLRHGNRCTVQHTVSEILVTLLELLCHASACRARSYALTERYNDGAGSIRLSACLFYE